MEPVSFSKKHWLMGLELLRWFAAVFFAVWIVQLILGIGPNMIFRWLEASDNVRTFLGSTITRLGILAATYYFTDFGLRKVTGRGLRKNAFPTYHHWWRDLGVGSLITLLAMGIIFTIELQQGWLVVEYYAWQNMSRDAYLRSVWLSILSNLDAGVGEEILFRGLLLFGLCRAWGKMIGMAVTAVLFAVVHLFVTGASHTNWLLFSLLLTVPGVVLGIAYLRSGSLWLPIGIHFTWDLAYDIFNVSGGSHPGLFGVVTRQQGPEWFVGTGFGIEVGLAGAPVAAAVLAGTWFYTRECGVKRRGNP